MSRDDVTVWAPASLSNLGPGFDCLGVAISDFGDRIRARCQTPGEVSWNWHRDSSWSAPVRSAENTAVVAARSMLKRLGSDSGVHLEICKQGRAGSGLGSSAASAVAGAFAVAALHGQEADLNLIREAALDGEQTSSGARHGDNVLPALYGGFVLAQSDRLACARSLDCPTPVHLAIILPAINILTSEARSLLPVHVSFAATVRHASLLGLLVNAIRNGDAVDMGVQVMSDSIVEPLRASLLAPYADIRSAALEAGALGAALSGSGPALFAICPSTSSAHEVADAMKGACLAHNVDCLAKATTADPRGARLVTGPDNGGPETW